MQIYDLGFGIFNNQIGVFIKKNNLSDYLWYNSLEDVYDKIKSFQILEPTFNFEYCEDKITANQTEKLKKELKILIEDEVYNGILFWIDYKEETINVNYKNNLLRSKYYFKSLKESFANIADTGVIYPTIKFGTGFTLKTKKEMNAELESLIECFLEN